MSTVIRQIDALISLHFHVLDPGQLDDDLWMEKWRQIQWLSEKGILGLKLNENG